MADSGLFKCSLVMLKPIVHLGTTDRGKRRDESPEYGTDLLPLNASYHVDRTSHRVYLSEAIDKTDIDCDDSH